MSKNTLIVLSAYAFLTILVTAVYLSAGFFNMTMQMSLQEYGGKAFLMVVSAFVGALTALLGGRGR